MHSHRLSYSGPHSKYVKLGAAAVASGVVASVIAHNRDKFRTPKLNSTVIEAISGAAGEVAQIALVYPLDTVKVRCQAAGLSSTQVFTNLWKATGGNWAAIAAALYAGALPAVPLAVLVGAVHYVSFGASRRAFAGCSDNSKRKEQPPPGDSLQQQQQQQQSCQHIIVTHGMTGTHFLPMEDPAAVDEPYGEGSQDTANCISSSSSSTSSSSNSGSGSSGSSSSAAAFFPAAAGEAAGEAPLSQEVGEGSMTVNIASAVITAVVTALVEAPLEQFRHNSQAGNIKGNFVREMWRVLRTAGPRSLYYGFIPYCLESWPYDISELLVVGAASDVRGASPSARAITPAAWDLAVGGLAGTVAVLVSMPFDVVKTYMQTHGSSMATEGLRESAVAFWATGRALVAKGGPGALFVGLAPRLAHQVPGAMVCWLAIEGCQRYLKNLNAETDNRNTLTS